MLHSFKILTILMLIWLGSSSFAQQWAVTHGGLFIGDFYGDEKAYSIVAGIAGESYVTGYTQSAITGFDICTIKYDAFGDTAWARYYNGSGNGEDKACAITIDRDQNIYVTGYATSDTNGTDIVVIKYSSGGVQLWVQTFNGPGNESDKAYAIVLDNIGNIYVGGYVTSTGEGEDMAVVKYSSAGVYLWARNYSGAGHFNDEAKSLAMLGDAVVLTGYTMDGALPENENITTVKFDAAGNQEWVRFINGSGSQSDKAYAIVTDGDNFIYITGYETNTGTGKDILTAKYDSEGTEVWKVFYNAYGFDDEASSIALAGTDVLVVTGKISKGIDSTTQDFITIKYNTLNGSTDWDKTYDGTSDKMDFANAIVISPSGTSVYVTGVSSSGVTTASEDIYTVKYDVVSGSTLDSALFSTGITNADVAFDIALDSLENIYITGYTEVLGGDKPVTSGWLTAKYGKGRLSAKNTHNNQPKLFTLYQNYPNPFNPSTVIKFDISAQSKVSLKVFDVLGREVCTLVNQDLKSGSYTYSFKQTNLSSGIYFYELTAGNFRDVKKMMLIK
jgi:hypothetical protein